MNNWCCCLEICD